MDKLADYARAAFLMVLVGTMVPVAYQSVNAYRAEQYKLSVKHGCRDPRTDECSAALIRAYGSGYNINDRLAIHALVRRVHKEGAALKVAAQIKSKNVR